MEGMEKKRHPLPEGVSLFLAHLAELGVSQTAFCDEKGIDRITVQRIVNGERQRITVDFAMKMRDATGGKVPVETWESPSARSRRQARAPLTLGAAA